MQSLSQRAGLGNGTAMSDRASQVLCCMLDAPVVTVEPRISHGVHGENDDLALSVEWHDAEGVCGPPIFRKTP